MFQMGGVGPMFGQLGFFHKFAGKDIEDKRPRDRYVAESRRLLGVLDARLKGRHWIMGDDYTIADMAILPWVRNLVGFMARAIWWAMPTLSRCSVCWRPSWRVRRCRPA
jgi:GST-like protein